MFNIKNCKQKNVKNKFGREAPQIWAMPKKTGVFLLTFSLSKFNYPRLDTFFAIVLRLRNLVPSMRIE